MKNSLFKLLFLISLGSTGVLPAVTLDCKVESEGELLMAQTIDVPFGKSDKVENENLRFEVLATKEDSSEGNILLECSLSELKGSKSETIMEPKLVAKMNEEATITIGSEKREISISITPS